MPRFQSIRNTRVFYLYFLTDIIVKPSYYGQREREGGREPVKSLLPTNLV